MQTARYAAGVAFDPAVAVWRIIPDGAFEPSGAATLTVEKGPLRFPSRAQIACLPVLAGVLRWRLPAKSATVSAGVTAGAIGTETRRNSLLFLGLQGSSGWNGSVDIPGWIRRSDVAESSPEHGSDGTSPGSGRDGFL